MALLTIYHQADVYEVTFTSAAITHIEKTLGDSQVRREVLFNRLPTEVKNEIKKCLHLADQLDEE